jgi:hypothetical protein
MSAFKRGGNPLIDRRESMERYSTIVKPILGNKGFEKIKGSSHVMVCHSSKTIVIPKSSPSDTKHVREMKTLVRELRKKYDGYSIYVIFHRDKEEWSGKPIYMNTLRRIMDIKSLNGVICGIDNFIKSLNDICGNTLTFKI